MQAQKLLLRAAFRLAPDWAEDRAARLFLRPRRKPPAARSRDVSRETPPALESPLMLETAAGPLAVWSYGREQDPAIQLVHGWEDDHASWAPLAGRLVARGFRVLAPDLPGHGRSPADLATIPAMAAGVAAAGRIAPLQAVIAHSLGGTATLLAASELGLTAPRFAILAAPNHPRLFAGAAMGLLGLDAARTARVFAAIERMVGRSMDSLYLPPKLRGLQRPGLILHSRDDRTVPLQHSQENAAAWPGAELRRLDGLGHRRLMTDPGVHAMLLHFVTAAAPADAFGPKADAAA